MKHGFAVLSLIGLIWLGCSSKGEDVVTGVPPVSQAFQHMEGDIASMANMSNAARSRFIDRNYPNLDRDVLHFLRQDGYLTRTARVSMIEFRYGSAENVRAQSRDGEVTGHFDNQLIARVHSPALRQPIDVAVLCFNGVSFEVAGDYEKLGHVATRVPREQFRIGPREGLVHHVDYTTAIDLAERHHLPLYRGRGMRSERLISPDEARSLESQTDRVQVTVFVRPGDYFDLQRGIYTPARR